MSAFLALALCAGACSRTSPPEVVGDDPRIVVLSPALADLLVDLALGDLIVGRHAYDRFLPDELPTVGDQSGIDYERLIRLCPTHVLLEWGSRDPPSRLLSLGADRAWVIRDFPMLTLDDIRDAALAMGEIFDHAEQAQALAARMDDAWTAREGLGAHAGRTLPVYWTDPVGVAGPGSFHHQILEALGIEPAVREGSAYIQMDPEDLRRLDPDTIVIFSPGLDEAGLADALAPLERLQLRAINEGRVVLINDAKCQTPSSAMIEVAEEVAEKVGALPVVSR